MSFEGQDRASRTYRPEVDGLRAIAVLAVVAFHARLPSLQGGFAGVDVFFVISGYLITGIIVRQLDAGTFSLRNFYLSRARRILPALLFVLGACTIFSLLLPDAEQTAAFGKSALAALFFVANVAAWKTGQGYFDQTADEQPLIHLWSLSVEEQFYLLYPLVLLFVRRTRLVLLLGLITVASLALAEWASCGMPSATYYLAPTRSWELLAGCLLGLGEARRGQSWADARASKWLAWGGLIVVIASFFFVQPTDRFPGFAALPTIIGVVLILACADRGSGAGRLLASRPLLYIGLWSYSIFLWHQPALAFARLLPLDAPGPVTLSGILLIVLGASALTWRWIEQPFRDRRAIPPSRLVPRLIMSVSLLAIVTGSVWGSDGLPQRLSRRAVALEELPQHYRSRQLDCYIGPGYARTAGQACVLGKSGPLSVALVGDSHAAALAPGLQPILDGAGKRALLLVRSSCPPLLRFDEFDPDHQAGCAATRADVIRTLSSNPQIETVILAARWTYYLSRHFADNGEGGREPGPAFARPSSEERRAFARSVQDTVSLLLGMGKKVVLVYPIPEAGWDVPLYLAKADMRGMRDVSLSVSADWVARRNAAAAAMLDALGSPSGLYHVVPSAALCGPRRCAVAEAGTPLYFDANHPTAMSARAILKGLAPVLSH